MRAIFFHEGERWSGAARAFVAAARGLTARGWQCAVACCAGGPVERAARAAGVAVVPMDGRPSLLGGQERLRRALKDRHADVVYVHTEHEQLAAATAVWRAKRGVVVRRLPPGATFTTGRSARTALRLAPHAVLATWPEQGTTAGELGPLPTVVADLGVGTDVGTGVDQTSANGRHTPVPTSVPGSDPGPGPESDPEPGPEPGPPGAWRGERRLVCVCEPDGRARTAVVLRAVAMLAPRHRELRLVLVGSGAADEQLRLHAAALGIHRLVRHAVAPAEDAAARAAAHVGWVTAEGDDGAFGALDFMAAGVPVLADRGTAPARYVADAISGVHLVPGDVPGTAASLAALLARDPERTAMGNAGRARLMRSYTEAAMVDGFARAAAAGAQKARR